MNIKQAIRHLIAMIRSTIWAARNNGMNISVQCEFGEVKAGVMHSKLRFTPHSFLSNWCKALRALMAWEDFTVTDTGGTGRTFDVSDAQYQCLWVESSVGNDNWGIMFGTGDLAVDQDDYQLESLIPHGTGAGELEYSATSVSEVSQNGNVTSFQLTRTVTNNSGSAIIVKECGLGVKIPDAVQYYMLIERTVLPTPYQVDNGATAYGRYTIRITT